MSSLSRQIEAVRIAESRVAEQRDSLERNSRRLAKRARRLLMPHGVVVGGLLAGVLADRWLFPPDSPKRSNEEHGSGSNEGSERTSFLAEIGSSNRRIALEYTNPSLTLALLQRGLEVIDGVAIAERARIVKSAEEIECIRWACAVAEHGIARLREALRPGITELQLWGILNYTNLANNGDWHNGRMLASGPRINPWLQEASPRSVCSGDLVGFDTDMVGPGGYFADISRTFHCGPASPTRRQKQLYRLAHAEITHNLGLLRPGIRRQRRP